MNNEECKVRPQFVNVNSEEPVFFPFSIKISKCSGSCNNINNLYSKLCVPDVVKTISVRVFNLMSRTNETRHTGYIGYITIKKIDDYENIYSLNPLYLILNRASGYIEEKNGNKYSIFDDSVNENEGLLKTYADIWDGIKNKIKTINGGQENDYGKDYKKIKFNSDDDLPLNKPLKFHTMTIIIRSVSEEGGKFYPQAFLDDALYKL